MADGDLPHFAQVRCLDGELVLSALLKVIFVIVQSPFTLISERMSKDLSDESRLRHDWMCSFMM